MTCKGVGICDIIYLLYYIFNKQIIFDLPYLLVKILLSVHIWIGLLNKMFALLLR